MIDKKSLHSKPMLRSVSEAVKPPAPLRQIIDDRNLNTHRENPVDDSRRAIEKIEVARAHPNDHQANRFERSAVGTLIALWPRIDSLVERGIRYTGEKCNGGNSRKGKLSPIHAAVERICAELPDPTLEGVLDFMADVERMADLYESRTNPIDIEVQEDQVIDEIEEVVQYRRRDGTEKEITFKTIANYVSEYNQKKNILPASRDASISG